MAQTGKEQLRLVIVTPTGEVVRASSVSEVTAPGLLGDFGVLPGHIPFLSALRPGVLTYVEDGHSHVVAVGEGFVEVGLKEEVVVLTDAAATPETIDLEEVTREEAATARALAALSPVDQPAEYRAARAANAWAAARKEAALRARSGG